MSIEVRAFRDVTPCSLVDSHKRFGASAVLIFRPWTWWQQLFWNVGSCLLNYRASRVIRPFEVSAACIVIKTATDMPKNEEMCQSVQYQQQSVQERVLEHERRLKEQLSISRFAILVINVKICSISTKVQERVLEHQRRPEAQLSISSFEADSPSDS